MNIAIVGPGKLGSGLARLWTRKGHHVSLTFSRDAAKLEALATELGERAVAATVKDAVANSEIIALTTKWSAVPAALAQAGSLDGKIILDCTNTMSPRTAPDGSVETRSCAEVLAEMAPGARVIKTFNQAFEQLLNADSRRFDGQRPTMFYAGGDEEAKKLTAALIDETDFEPIDAGPLENARYLEQYAILIIRLGHTLGMGTNIAMKLLRR